jgi:hypothetical protein
MKGLAGLVLAIHLAWILFVMFGALWTRGRPFWTGVHIAALVWGILAEVGPWACPLTSLEQALESRIGAPSYAGDCVVHYLDAIVYPHVPVPVIIGFGVGVCALNLLVYAVRLMRLMRARRRAVEPSL